jgi:hypothetical protein
MDNPREDKPVSEQERSAKQIVRDGVIGAFTGFVCLMLMMRPDPTVYAAVIHWAFRLAGGIIIAGSLWTMWRGLRARKKL